MTTISMYHTSVKTYIRQLENLSVVLKKGENHAKNKKIDEEIFINARLAPDMFNLARQVQIACDFAKSSCARLAGVEIPSFIDNEKTFSELQERIKKTIDFVSSIKESQVNGSEERKISYSAHGMDFNFVGKDYLLDFALPNFYFHFTTTYAILRSQGVEIGKQDFIGKI